MPDKNPTYAESARQIPAVAHLPAAQKIVPAKQLAFSRSAVPYFPDGSDPSAYTAPATSVFAQPMPVRSPGKYKSVSSPPASGKRSLPAPKELWFAAASRRLSSAAGHTPQKNHRSARIPPL